MRKSIDPAQWQTHRVRGRIYEICTSVRGETVVLGQPESDDEEHNCDANGCGQDHVLWRGTTHLGKTGEL